MEQILFSVLIVGYNSPDDIEHLLHSLRGLPSGSECEILIAENGDLKKAEMEALSGTFGARIIFLPNPGFGTACNRLAEKASGKILLLANPDLRFESDILPALARHLEDPQVGAVGPVLRHLDGSEQISWNLPMDLWWELLEAHGLQTWWRWRVIRRFQAEDPTGPWNVGVATAACLALRRDVYWKVGGFDEGFFLNSEDIDLCDRICAAGHLVLVDPTLQALHGNSRIQTRHLGKFVADRQEGKWTYISRRYRGLRLLAARLLWVEMTVIRLVVGWLTLRGNERTRLPGYWKVLVTSLRLRPRK